VYQRGGEHMLTLIPKEQRDSIATIESIQIFDDRFKTIKGLNLSSTFKDIVDNYTVNKVESTFTTAVLFIDELNVTIAIDNLRKEGIVEKVKYRGEHYIHIARLKEYLNNLLR
jgi:hypothetical protein